MEDEHASKPGPRAGSMRDGGLEEAECDAGEEPEEHPDDGEDEDEEEGEVHQGDNGGGEGTGAVDYAEVEVDVDQDGGTEITNACSPPPRRAPDLSSAPHFSRRVIARRATARRVHRAAQIAPRKPRRHTAPILSRPTSSTTSAYPPALQGSGFCSKLRAPRRGTSLGPFVCGARACSLCSLAASTSIKQYLIVNYVLFSVWF